MKPIFEKFKTLSIAVLGDYCLDEYLWIDAALNEPSLETGLIAYQCLKRETSPGAAGTIAKNLANLGIGNIYALGYVGSDGRGFELCQGLDALGINRDYLVSAKERATFTHTKPWIIEEGKTRELNRIDIKNPHPTPPELEDAVLANLKKIINKVDALIVLDHVAEANYGIITDKVRKALPQIAAANPKCIVYADSRCRIGLFEGMMLKGNQYELCHAVYGQGVSGVADARVQLAADPSVERTAEEITQACETLRKKTGQPVICTLGEHGVHIYQDGPKLEIPATPVSGQTDVCGAGDMFTAAFISTLAAGASPDEAGKIGNMAASICVTQLGTSGHVTTKDLEAIHV